MYHLIVKLFDGFPLDADISLAEVRSEPILNSRLQTHHCLRLRRRNEVIGVLVDRAAWDQLVSYVRHLEHEADRREDEAVGALVAERSPKAAFEPGTPERAADIFEEADRLYERLCKERGQ